VSPERKHLRLGFSIWATGFHPAGWRLPEARADGTFDPAFLRRTAQLSEAAKLDFYFIGDRVVGLPEQQSEHPNLVLRPEALTLAGFVAAVTERIGIVATVNTTYAHPFNVARATATLDHLSGGRLALNVVTGRDPEAAANFGRDAHWDTDQRFDTATEFTEVVHRLWDSWEDGALVAEKDGGRFVDAARVHRIDFRGEQFDVRGPLNIVRPPQGQVPILTAGESERSREYGAKYADVRFGTALQLDKARAYYAEVKARLVKHGRAPESQSLAVWLRNVIGIRRVGRSRNTPGASTASTGPVGREGQPDARDPPQRPHHPGRARRDRSLQRALRRAGRALRRLRRDRPQVAQAWGD
jgi:FMN-dependent oxidoreductase (nitrilotriacetate monooxygenase family)